MKRIFFIFIGIILISSCISRDDNKQLFIYAWYGIIPEEVIAQFEAETGIKVTLDYYDANQILEARLLTKKTGYDIVMPSAWPYGARQLQHGLFHKLDKSLLPNFVNIDPFLLKHMEPSDPGHMYVVPYLWGVTGIAYNKQKVAQIMPDAPLDSWALIMEPEVLKKFASLGVCLLDDPTEIFVALQMYLGFNHDDWSAVSMDRALAQLAKIKPYIQKFVGSQGINDLAKGDAVIIQNYTSDVENAQDLARQSKTGIEVGFIVPKEGARIWVDVFAIPIDSHHPDNAHKFINFMMRGDVAAKVTNMRKVANANLASTPFLSPGIMDNPLIYPADSLKSRLRTPQAIPREYEKLLNRKLIQIMTGTLDSANLGPDKRSVDNDGKK